MKGRAAKIALLLVLVAAIGILRLSGVGDALSLENIQRHRDELVAAVKERYVLALVLYLCGYIVVTAFSIPGATVMTLAGGYVFGTLPTVLCVNVAATTGAALAFLSARYLLGSGIQERYRDQLATFNREMEQNGTRYLLTLRLLPVFPFFLVNFLSGLTRVRLVDFLWTTSLGIIPGSAVFAYAGRQLETVHDVGDILSFKVLSAFLALALLTFLPSLWDRFRKKP